MLDVSINVIWLPVCDTVGLPELPLQKNVVVYFIFSQVKAIYWESKVFLVKKTEFETLVEISVFGSPECKIVFLQNFSL